MIGGKQFEKINWEVQGKATCLSTRNRKFWVLKFISGWCSSGKIIGDQRLILSCPHRNYELEDNTHIIPCKTEGALQEWDNSTLKLEEWLDSNKSFLI